MLEKTQILATVSIYHAINDGAVAVIPILFPVFKTMFNLSYTQVGVVTGGGLLLSLIAQLMLGRFSDGKNSKNMLSLGVLLIVISMLLLTLTKGFCTLILFMFLLRFSSSFFHPIGTGWISRIFKKERIDWAMGTHSGFADLGGFIAVATTLYLADTFSWTMPLYLWALFGSLFLIMGVIISRNAPDEYLILKNNRGKQKISEAFDEAVEFLKHIKLLIPALMISGAAWGVVLTYFPLLLYERTHLSLTTIGFVVAVWIGVGSIASFNYGRICTLLKRRNVIIIAYLIMGLIGVLLAVVTSMILIILMMALLGLALFVTYPALASIIADITDEQIEGRTFGVIFTLQLGGGAILLFLSGVLSDLFGIWIPFVLLGGLSLAFTIVFTFGWKKSFMSASKN